MPVSAAKPTSVHYAPRSLPLPAPLDAWLPTLGFHTVRVSSANEMMGVALRGRPRVIVLDARDAGPDASAALGRVKADSYTSVVPCVMVVDSRPESFRAGYEAGADEVVRPDDHPSETITRLEAMLRRSDRDLTVHPSTRLPGAVGIEADVQRRLGAGAPFAMCYADLDHFKEFNDRYSYHEGDRIIRILAMILHDVVKGIAGEEGFVGHIGGDDFIFVIPVPAVNAICGEVISVFDTLIPFQYSEQDRRAGYFFGKDRRGQLHRVPLMTLSIGVVTNERRVFSHAAQVSELANEMKTYAKTLPGSVYAVDRRTSGAAGASEPVAARVSVHRVGERE